MIRHLFIAGLRNMAANRLLAGIAILGLALGFTGAMLMALVIRSQLTFDNFIPGHERIYLGITDGTQPGTPPWVIDRSHREFASLLTLNIPEIESAARLMVTDQIISPLVVFSRGNVTAAEKIYWSDPNAFDVLPLPALHGDLAAALRRPDGLVLPRAAARKYFGRENVVGETISLNGHPMIVRAVIEDLPLGHTQLETGIFASNLAPFLGFTDYKPRSGGGFTPADIGVRTYFRLRDGADIETVRAKAAPLVNSIYGKMGVMPLVRIDRVHLVENLNAAVAAGPNADVTAFLAVAGLTGLLVLFLAGVNFVNLTLARAARREREIGTRKVCGAGRPSLMAQFLGEALIAAALAALMALVLAEWLLPVVNAFLGTGAAFDVRHDPLLIPSLLLAVAVAGLAAGAYPAFVLSGLKPVLVLKGLASSLPDIGMIRSGLVVLQFAILIVLAIAAGVVWQQWHYATGDGLRAQTDQILIVRKSGGNVSCPAAFADSVRGLAGVAGAACSGVEFLDAPIAWQYPEKNGAAMDVARIDTGIFALYGIAPLAGRLEPLPSDYDIAPEVVISASTARLLGFATPQAAIGKIMTHVPATNRKAPTRITAVVPDFGLYPVTHKPNPAVFIGLAGGAIPGSLLHVRLRGGDIPETLAAIDRLWVATGQSGAIDRFFLDDHMQQRYLAMLRQAQMIAVSAGLAVLLACLGLVGIAVSTAERRIKEIGVRKAMGATTAEVVALLLWQFSRPVLWANLIAWPVAFLLMQRWLAGFAYHIDLGPGLFLAASAVTMLIALASVSGEAFMVARQKPVAALRYE